MTHSIIHHRSLLSLVHWGLLLAISGTMACSEAPAVFVNELMPSNTTVLADEAGEYDDWIELYNASSETVDLEGYFISDDVTDPYKRRLPAGLVIEANATLLLWADDDSSQGSAHLPFKLAKDGESVLLTDPDGALLDSVEYSDAVEDQSLARFPDGEGELILCGQATPGSLNGTLCGE